MILPMLDPALLIYRPEDWHVREPNCFRRLLALMLHRQMARQYDLRFAVSEQLVEVICQSFPYDDRSGEFNDLRRFLYEDLQKAYYINTSIVRKVQIAPAGVICEYVDKPQVLGIWEALLCGYIDTMVLEGIDPQIATWEVGPLCGCSAGITLTVHGYEVEVHIPLVWNDETWAKQLIAQEWWPDLHKCVELYFKANIGPHEGAEIERKPIVFECADTFWKSAGQLENNRDLRVLFIKALTKLVYQIHDSGLGREEIDGVVRFRVDDFWRVHCRKQSAVLVLEQFGPHRLGGIG